MESELESALNALQKAKASPPKEVPKPSRAVVVEEDLRSDLEIASRQAELAGRLSVPNGEVDHGVGLSHGAISVGAWIIGLDPENRLGFGEHARPGRAWQLPRLARDSCDSVE